MTRDTRMTIMAFIAANAGKWGVTIASIMRMTGRTQQSIANLLYEMKGEGMVNGDEGWKLTKKGRKELLTWCSKTDIKDYKEPEPCGPDTAFGDPNRRIFPLSECGTREKAFVKSKLSQLGMPERYQMALNNWEFDAYEDEIILRADDGDRPAYGRWRVDREASDSNSIMKSLNPQPSF